MCQEIHVPSLCLRCTWLLAQYTLLIVRLSFVVVIVGPVWPTDAWTCTSDSDFVVHSMVRGIGTDPLPQIKILVQDQGTQSFYSMDNSESVSFSVGNQADELITITRTGTVTGFLTLQTTSNAQASCIPV